MATTNSSDASDFECNICLDLAQDPIVTLCGHLFCWPCLYKWLHFHSQSQECPVCKALIQEQKLVPLYGRGKNSTDPRSSSSNSNNPTLNIPNRPSGQRPETAPPPENNHFHPNGFGFLGGFAGFPPAATARFGNFALSASFGGLIPSLFNFQMHGFSDAMHHGHGGYHGHYHHQQHPYGYAHGFHGGHGHHPHVHHQHRHPTGQQDNYLKMLFLIIGVLVILTLISN